MQLSVCIPTYNHGSLVTTAIESVLKQSYQDFEIVVVDNASTDNTEQILSRFTDPRIRYFRNLVNLGFSRNLQRSFELAQGEFLQFLCADDFLYANCLQRTVTFLLQHPHAAFVHTGHNLVDPTGKSVETRIYEWKSLVSGKEFLEQLMEWGIAGVCLSSVVMRREYLERVGGIDMDLEFAADYGMWMKLSFLGEVGYVPQALVAYRVHADQTTRILIPKLRLKLVEKFLGHARANEVPTQRYGDRLLREAVSEGLREFPKRRKAGVSVVTLVTEAKDMLKKYRRHVHLFPDLFYIFLALFPPFFLEGVYRFHSSVRKNDKSSSRK